MKAVATLFFIPVSIFLMSTGFSSWVEAAARLRPVVTVNDDRIRIGDLFEDAGPAADHVVAPAPDLGRKTIFEAEVLARIARINHIDWQPSGGLDRVIISRASVTVRQEDIRDVLIKALTRQISAPRIDVDFETHIAEMQFPSDQSLDISVRNLRYNALQSRFSAEIVASAGGASQNIPVSGRAYGLVDVPVSIRRIIPGEVIAASDLDYIQVRTDQIPGDMAMMEAQLVGQTVRRAVPAQTPINLRDVLPLKLVIKGAIVTMVLQTPNMSLSTQGRALQDGAKGDVIRVINTQSNRTVDAVVTGHNQVSVSRPNATIN
ncbi:flagella basal body P-ring formation protein FlgA [Azospirillaceae bacterium]